MRFLVLLSSSVMAAVPTWFLVAHAAPLVVKTISLDATFHDSKDVASEALEDDMTCFGEDCEDISLPLPHLPIQSLNQKSASSAHLYNLFRQPQSVVLDSSDSKWDQVIARSLEGSDQKAIAKSLPSSIVTGEASASAMTAVDVNYSLGAGDRLQITVFNVPEYSGEQQVLADGSLNLPAVGKLPIAGMTIEEAEAAIAARYQSELRYPRVTVSLLRPRPLQIAVSGEVNKPGSYILEIPETSQFPSIVQAIQSAGGMTQAADLRQVEVRRLQRSGTVQIITINLWELLQNGDLRQNLPLRDGDSILIPPVATVSLIESAQLASSNLVGEPTELDVAVVGEVFRPGVYKFSAVRNNSTDPTQARPTVTKAIQQAGGIKPSADIRQIQVRRPTRNGTEQIISIDFWQLFRSGDLTQDLVLQQGDTISIPTAQSPTDAETAQIVSTNLSPDEILVNVVGEVKNPGTVEVPANTTLNQALLAAGGFTDRSRKIVELIRLNPNGTILQRQIEMDLSQGVNSETNPLLWNNDVIVVDRTSAARFGDQLSNILGPLLQLLPVRVLF